MPYTGLSAFSTEGYWITCHNPSEPIIKNHRNMTGPKDPPTTLVPNRWNRNSSISTTMTISTTRVLPGTISCDSPGTVFSPSMAEVMEIGGVMIPSASSVPAPMIATRNNALL